MKYNYSSALWRLCIILFAVTLLSCKGKRPEQQEKEVITQNNLVEYATGFTVRKTADYTEVRIRDPWDTTKYLQRYILVDRTQTLPSDLPEGILVRTPLRRVIACTSVHCSWLELLGIDRALVGVCESRYIDLDFVKKGLLEGGIADIGEASAPDIEKLVELAPEAIITSPLSGAPYGRVEKTGIPQLKCVDYMEASPLGRAEWIRFLALFFEKEAEADSIFSATVSSYNTIKKLTSTVQQRPGVMTEMKTGNVWYVPGGKSYMANLFRDAGASYGLEEDEHSGSVPLSFETVFEKCGNADFWLIKYNRPDEMSYADLRDEYGSNAYFTPYKNKRVFVCNTGKVPYYEEMPIHPDYILKELVGIFHPELLPDYRLRYYKAMQED